MSLVSLPYLRTKMGEYATVWLSSRLRMQYVLPSQMVFDPISLAHLHTKFGQSATVLPSSRLGMRFVVPS